MPQGVSCIVISAGGAGGNVSGSYESGGGGSGRFILDRPFPVTAGQTINITVGSGNTIIGAPINITLLKGSDAYNRDGGSGGCGGSGGESTSGSKGEAGLSFDGGGSGGAGRVSTAGTEYGTPYGASIYKGTSPSMYGIGGTILRFGRGGAQSSPIVTGYCCGAPGSRDPISGGPGIVVIEW